MKVSAIANANIALSKYWGKRDPKLMLPQNGSVSMTLDGMYAKTTVEFDPKYTEDIMILNGQEVTEGKEKAKAVKHLDLIRDMAGIQTKAKVSSVNNFPTAAGFASSAAGFAAFSLAGSKAAGLDLSKKDLTMLSRRGSGSATRSIYGGFGEWLRGEKEDGSDSYGVQIAPAEHWPEFRMLACVTSRAAKKVKSRAGMAQTIETCPYYKDWLATVNQDIENIRKGILEKNFTLVGKVAEMNALKMHATMMTTSPPIIYWNSATMNVVHNIMQWRGEGLEAYFTMDAGPQVKVMCLEKDAPELKKRLSETEGVLEVIELKAGPDARVIEEHMF